MTKRNRTDNTMIKKQRTKGQTITYKTLHRKLKIEQHKLPLILSMSSHSSYYIQYTIQFKLYYLKFFNQFINLRKRHFCKQLY